MIGVSKNVLTEHTAHTSSYRALNIFSKNRVGVLACVQVCSLTFRLINVICTHLHTAVEGNSLFQKNVYASMGGGVCSVCTRTGCIYIHIYTRMQRIKRMRLRNVMTLDDYWIWGFQRGRLSRQRTAGVGRSMGRPLKSGWRGLWWRVAAFLRVCETYGLAIITLLRFGKCL